MADTDLSTQFQAVCQKATDADRKINNARLSQQSPAATDAPSTAPDVAGHRSSPDPGDDAVAARWQRFHGRWRSHVDRVNGHIEKHRADLNASDAVREAGTAESYAKEAIQFALDAIDEAEEATLQAMSARAKADALTS